MMAVVFCRVEERLIHGQITCAWAKTLDFDEFVVVAFQDERLHLPQEHLSRQDL